ERRGSCLGREPPDDRVPRAMAYSAAHRLESRRDPVRDRGLVAGLARDVDQGLEQVGEGFGGHGSARCDTSIGPWPPATRGVAAAGAPRAAPLAPALRASLASTPGLRPRSA